MGLDLVEPDARVLDHVVEEAGSDDLVVVARLRQQLRNQKRVVDVGAALTASALMCLQGERQRLCSDRVRLDKRRRGLYGRKLLPQCDLQAFDDGSGELPSAVIPLAPTC